MTRAAKIRWAAAALVAVAILVGVLGVHSWVRGREHAAGGAIGDWGSSDGPRVTFSVTGNFEGHDSCNSFSGRWHEAEEGIAISETIMTLVACLDGSAQWLTGAHSFRVVGDTLHAYDDAGTELGSLPRRK